MGLAATLDSQLPGMHIDLPASCAYSKTLLNQDGPDKVDLGANVRLRGGVF